MVGKGSKRSSSRNNHEKVKVLTKRFVQFPIEISEDTYNFILRQNKDPSKFVSDLVEVHFSKEINYDGDKTVVSNNFDKLKESFRGVEKRDWTQEMMKLLIDHLVSAMVERPDIDVLLALLASYAEYGVARPSSQSLRNTRGLAKIEDESWNQELRTSKSRLTITAKHLDLPHKELFSSPYGKGAKRVHPIHPECFKELISWKERGIMKDGEDDPTGLLAARRFEDILKTPTPHHLS